MLTHLILLTQLKKVLEPINEEKVINIGIIAHNIEDMSADLLCENTDESDSDSEGPFPYCNQRSHHFYVNEGMT